MAQERRRFPAREKLAILRRHFLERVPVSDLCHQNHLNTTAFYRWQNEFFENGAAPREARASFEAFALYEVGRFLSDGRRWRGPADGSS